ncbi:MAG: hypothetical protein AAFN93_09585, partial [Bacteroidota bacterium]
GTGRNTGFMCLQKVCNFVSGLVSFGNFFLHNLAFLFQSTDQVIQTSHQARDKVADFLQAHEARVSASSYDSGFDAAERLVHLRSEKERLEKLLATSDSPEQEEELLDAEVTDVMIVGESKELEKAA